MEQLGRGSVGGGRAGGEDLPNGVFSPPRFGETGELKLEAPQFTPPLKLSTHIIKLVGRGEVNTEHRGKMSGAAVPGPVGAATADRRVPRRRCRSCLRGMFQGSKINILVYFVSWKSLTLLFILFSYMLIRVSVLM